jgi:hypothetical protein
MLIDPDKTKVVCSDPKIREVILLVCRKAAGKQVDELVICRAVATIEQVLVVDPSMLKKPEAKPSVSTEDNEKNCSGGGDD